MASIAVEVTTEASPAAVWDAIRDIGALHARLVPGFVVATELVPGGRGRLIVFSDRAESTAPARSAACYDVPFRKVVRDPAVKQPQ